MQKKSLKHSGIVATKTPFLLPKKKRGDFDKLKFDKLKKITPSLSPYLRAVPQETKRQTSPIILNTLVTPEQKIKELEEKLNHSQQKNAFLNQAGEVLSSSLNYPETLTTVAQLAIPKLADWCVVDIVDEQGRTHRIAVMHKDPKKIKLARRIEKQFPDDPNKTNGVRGVLKNGKSELYTAISDHLLVQAAQTPGHLQLLRSIGLTSVMIVPLKTKQKVLGIITFISAESKRHYTKADLQTAEELARRASTAIENARLYEAEKRLRYELEERVQQRTLELREANAGLENEIRERTKMEEALRGSEQLLRLVLDTLPVGIWVMDETGNIILENPAGQEMWAQKTFLGPSIPEEYGMWRADTGKRITREQTSSFRALLHGETTICEVMNIEAQDGNRRTILNSAYPIFDADQKITGAIIVNEDITDRQNIAEELSASKKELREFLDSQSTFSAKLDTSGNFLLANKSLMSALGITGTALFEQNFLRGKWWKYDPEAQIRVTEAFGRALEEQREITASERILTTANKTMVMDIRFIPILGADQTIEFMLMEGADSTEQRAAEAKLEESRRRLNEAQKIAHLGSWQWDVYYNVVFWSDELCAMYGVPEGFQGTHEGFLQLVHPDDRAAVARNLKKSLSEKTAFDFFYRILRTDGKILNLRARGDVMVNKKGDVIQMFGTAQDVTKEFKVDRAKTEFVSLASHQLRTPLSAVKWYAEALLSKEIGPLNKKQRLYLEQMRQANSRQLILLNDLLDVSRIDLGALTITPETLNLQTLTEEILRELRGLTRQKRLRIKTHFAKKAAIITHDTHVVRIMLQNLIDNAVKYTPAAGTISISARNRQGRVVIAVADTGCGIPVAEQGKIFTKLYRTDKARQLDIAGSGLGLYMVKSVAEFVGGKVWFTSTENKGSTFYLDIPINVRAKTRTGKHATKHL